MTSHRSRFILVIRDPFLLFLVLGTLTFGYYFMVIKDTPEQIVITAKLRQQLEDQAELHSLQRVTKAQLQSLIDNYVVEEVLFREAIKQNLHRHSPAIRAEIIDLVTSHHTQKHDMPSEEELLRHYATNITDYYSDSYLGFTHLFYAKPQQDYSSLKASLQKGESINSDSFLHGSSFPNVSQGVIAKIFGEAFAKDISEAPVGHWAGPFASVHGDHLVLVGHRQSPEVMPFEQARSAVLNDYLRAQAIANRNAQYEIVKSRYEVINAP